MKHALTAAALLLLSALPGSAHRLDEYLQGTIISIEKNRVDAQITLTPGVAVFPVLFVFMDSDGDGVISAAEQYAYAGRILGDLSLKIDGRLLTPQLQSVQFPAVERMEDGTGEIRIDFNAYFPRGGPNRKLVLENRHQSRYAAYQVNCLVPRDSDIRILSQSRSYTQAFYELDFAQAGVRSYPVSAAWLRGVRNSMGIIALLTAATLFLCFQVSERRWRLRRWMSQR